jgi:hypothetical protein
MEGEFNCESNYSQALSLYARQLMSGSDPERGHTVEMGTSSDIVEQAPFSDARINAQIVANVSRIGSAWLEWHAESREGSFDDQITETLVSTLDAHASALLTAVSRDAHVLEYITHLRRVGLVLLENAKRNSVLKHPYDPNPPLNSESLRKEVDLALVKLRSQRPGMLLRNSKTSSDYANATLQCRTDIGNAAAEMARHEDARRWYEWRNQIVNRIETRFEARYRHWQAEALERVLAAAKVIGPERRDPVGVEKWEDVEIEFLSDERVQVRVGDKTETRNYAEMGFMDKRNEKPNQSWIILRNLAEANGTLADSVGARKKWPAMEKHMQRIRKVLREHLHLADDPLPYTSGIGYRARFRIGCAASFQT